MSEELKPCPFCGEAERIVSDVPVCPQGGYGTMCRDCEGSALSTKEWNTRPIEDALRENNEHLVFALRNLIREAENSGICDNIIAEMFPESRNRSGAKIEDIAKDAKRAMNEAKAILKAIDNDLH